MAAPRLSFDNEEKKKEGSTPSPPPPVRDPKKHGFLSNLWSGIESVPGQVLDSEEAWRHAISTDIATSRGVPGLLSIPGHLAFTGASSLVTGGLGVDAKERARLKRIATGPFGTAPGATLGQEKQFVKGFYETTSRTSGIRGSKKFKEIWHDNPLAALGTVAVFVPPVSRIAGISKMATTIRAVNRVPLKDGATRAMTRTEAVKAATVESYYPGSLDKLGIEGSPFKPRVSGRRVSRTTTGRATQRAFDWTSGKIDTGIGVGARRTGPDTPLSATRRAAAGARRADDLQRGRLVTNAMRHVSTFADYLNDTTLSRVGTALGRRKDTLAARDAAVGAALHASSAVDPVEAVRLAAEDTKAILQSGKRSAHQGDIGDVAPDKRVGQTVFVTHGIDENGAPIREESTVTADHGDRVTVATPQGEMTIPHGRAHLLGPNGEGEVPLNADEIKMLERRYDHLTTAHDELLSEPRLQEKFRAATQSMADLGQMNEQLGVDYFTRGMDPTGSEAMAIRERLDARRNQFLDRLGGEGPQIDYYAGLWGDLQKAMDASGNFTPEQQLVFMSVLDRQARLWANEVPGRDPADYLSSPEGANLGGIDFAKPEDLESKLNAMFQTAGERNHLVTTTTTVLITGPPEIGNLVSTPKGMGFVHAFTGEGDQRIAWVDMNDGPNFRESFPVEEIRVSQLPWIGHPQRHDYVQTPDGPGTVLAVTEGPGPDFATTYFVDVFDKEGDYFVPGVEHAYRAGQVQRIEDPRDAANQPIFHLASQQALGGEKFPTKATAEQYRAAFEKAGVKSEEFYWMGLSRRPMLEDAVALAEAEMVKLEKKLAEDPGHEAVYGAEERGQAQAEIDRAQAKLDDYTTNPDESFLLDANWGGKSFPVQALQDAVDSRSHFLDLKEALYSSNAPDRSWEDRWGPNRGGHDGGEGSGLIIRDPTDEHPYHELVLALPSSDLYSSGHFPRHGEESHLVHIRFHEIEDTEGNPAILIDELQSDWNNSGRRSGWKEIITSHDRLNLERLRDKERRLTDLYHQWEGKLGMSRHQVDDWYDREIVDTMDAMNNEIDAFNRDLDRRMQEAQDRGDPSADIVDLQHQRKPRIFDYGTDREILAERLAADSADDPVFKDMMEARRRFDRLNEKRREAREAADAIEAGSGRYGAVNRGPLVMGDAAKYLAMKRMVRWAADHGQTRIIWTRGHEQGVRYGKFDDLPVRGDSSHLDPSDYGNDFYYPNGSTTINLGGHYRADNVSAEKLHAMQQAQPIEVNWADIEEYGDKYVLMPNGHPADTGGQVQVPGQLSLVDSSVAPPLEVNPARHPRWAEILHETEDGAVVRPIDPKWDPARLEIYYRGNTGDDSYGTWDVRIDNRLGETLYNDQLDGSYNDRSSLLEAVKTDWGRTNRNWTPSGWAEITSPADMAKMHQLIEILDESDTVISEFDYMNNHLDYEFDSDSWDEFVSNNESEDGAQGEFIDIRDHEPSGQRRVNNLRDGIATLERKRQEDIQRGVMSRDYATEIAQMKEGLAQAERNMENKGHTLGYDRMLPQMATRMLKPYRKEADHAPVELKHSIYEGRYGTEGQGVISQEGNVHGWVMDLPEKMRKDAKEGTTPLFQRGNDLIKGASTWVGGPDGQRFVALTEHADFSTLMHEFIGHATEEMKRRYPELWQAVEIDMKKPLEKWTVAEHEKFAKQVERYWMEGKAPSPELHTVMKMIKEWMKGVYASITQLGRPMPESTRILLNRHLGQGITARPGARSFVPHVSQFDTMMDSAPGGTRLAAGGSVVGVPQVDRRNFGARRNRGILWQSGELALSARPIIDQYFRRTKFMETEAVRQELFDGGHPLPKNGRAPEGAWLVRNPDAAPERLTARNKSRLSEEDFSRMTGEGDTPEEFVTKMEEIRRGHYAAPGEHPEWANDLENVRWVEGGKISQRIQNVFPTAPRGRVAASAGSLNAMARLTGIYLRPLHYLVGNIPQNVLMIGLTNPSALINSAKYGAYSFLPRVVREIGIQPRDLFAHDRHLYNQIKTETGDIQAGAGLPDFYTMANNRFQRGERRLNKISQGSAEKLGELADQPYRVSVWIAHAKKYGYNTPDEWRQLLDSERGTPEARIRDDIAQATREDMIDFNTLSPGERQNVSRFFYLWAFTRGFAKWPVTFAREYPGRLGLAAMQADPQRRDDNGLPTSWLPSSGVLKLNEGKGKVRDLGFLDPTAGLRQQIETGIQLAHGNFSGLGSMTTPPLETALQAVTGGPRAPKGGVSGFIGQIARDTVPFWDIGKKATTPGLKISDRVQRVLDFQDRFGVKPEIGRGKNAEKRRKEDEKIRSVLTTANRLEALPKVMLQQDAYWHWKYLEQQIRFGAQARRKGASLNDEEKMTILYATAADYFPQAHLPPLSKVLVANPLLQEKLRSDLSDAMFGWRNEAVNA